MQTVKAGNKRMIREINEAIVLDAIRTHGQISRVDIAQQTGLSAPTVTGITAALIDRTLIYEHSTGQSGGGRRPVLLALNGSAGYVIGVKVTETNVVAVLTDLEASVVQRRIRKLSGTSVEHVVAVLGKVVDDLRAKVPNAPLYGLGVGTAGVVDSVHGIVHHGTYAHWHDIPLGDLLEQRTQLPVVVDNDVNALVVSEHWFGAGKGIANMLVVSLGRGIGLGMILDGRLYRGAYGGAGEFGHVKISRDTTSCECGATGCLEAVAADPAIAKAASEIVGRTVTNLEAAELARSGNGAIVAVFDEAARHIGTALANLVNVLNPELIVLAGEGTHAADLIVPALEQALAEHTFNGLLDTASVVVEPWDDEAWARGAASLVLAELFQPALRPEQGSTRPSLNLARTT
ncbi:MAG: N-acetylglucosamine repressor [Ilumatobacter sp.]|jgi:N-acetylglucosamine repressor